MLGRLRRRWDIYRLMSKRVARNKIAADHFSDKVSASLSKNSLESIKYHNLLFHHIRQGNEARHVRDRATPFSYLNTLFPAAIAIFTWIVAALAWTIVYIKG